MAKRAVLLINLGSPDEPTVPAVRRYLREFLSDPRVIDTSAIARFMLVNFIISPFRSRTSAHAYQKVWTPSGSPLVVVSQQLAAKVQERLGPDYQVLLGMRYGQPSLTEVVRRLESTSVDELVVLPLFPQYSTAATASAIDVVVAELGKKEAIPHLRIIRDFYDDPLFIDAFVRIATPQLKKFQADHVLFSYHGLPVHQLTRLDKTGQHCHKSENCCDQIGAVNRYCYRAQCFAGTRALAKGLGLAPGSYSTAFQSRLGRAEWIKPYTDKVLPELREKGVKRLAVMCPTFVADCLETLEEIAMRAAEDWKALGGESLELVHSLNADDVWCDAVSQWVRAEPAALTGAERAPQLRRGERDERTVHA